MFSVWLSCWPFAIIGCTFCSFGKWGIFDDLKTGPVGTISNWSWLWVSDVGESQMLSRLKGCQLLSETWSGKILAGKFSPSTTLRPVCITTCLLIFCTPWSPACVISCKLCTPWSPSSCPISGPPIVNLLLQFKPIIHIRISLKGCRFYLRLDLEKSAG